MDARNLRTNWAFELLRERVGAGYLGVHHGLQKIPIVLEYFQERMANIFGKRYTVLEGFADFFAQSASSRSLVALH